MGVVSETESQSHGEVESRAQAFISQELWAVGGLLGPWERWEAENCYWKWKVIYMKEISRLTQQWQHYTEHFAKKKLGGLLYSPWSSQ
jgi:hypothetical protein